MLVTSSTKTETMDQLLRRFRQLYGDGGVIVLRAPARINILGEHVDYVSYLPTASLAFGSREHGMLMAFRATDDGEVRGASMDERFAPFRFALGESKTPRRDEQSWEEFVFNRPVPAPHWSNYVKGAVNFAQWKYGGGIRRGFSFLIDSTIPAASGASSSSALVVLAGAAIRQSNQIEFIPEELAQDSSQAEWFLGTRGGALDHNAICLAKQGYAVHLSYANNSAELVALSGEQFCWVTFFTHPADKGREVMLEYNERAAVSRFLIPAMIAEWSATQPGLAKAWQRAMARASAGEDSAHDDLEVLLSRLPEAITLSELRKDFSAVFQKCEASFPELLKTGDNLRLKLRDRALHHIGEAKRVIQAVSLLQSCKSKREAHSAMYAIGELLDQSHSSLRDFYEVSTPQVERLIKVLRAEDDLCGARLMGGGFGGNVLAIIPAEEVAGWIDYVQEEFYQKQNRDGVSEGSVMVSTPGEGLSMIEL
jgi:galactokinase